MRRRRGRLRTGEDSGRRKNGSKFRGGPPTWRLRDVDMYKWCLVDHLIGNHHLSPAFRDKQRRPNEFVGQEVPFLLIASALGWGDTMTAREILHKMKVPLSHFPYLCGSMVLLSCRSHLLPFVWWFVDEVVLKVVSLDFFFAFTCWRFKSTVFYVNLRKPKRTSCHWAIEAGEGKMGIGFGDHHSVMNLRRGLISPRIAI